MVNDVSEPLKLRRVWESCPLWSTLSQSLNKVCHQTALPSTSIFRH